MFCSKRSRSSLSLGSTATRRTLERKITQITPELKQWWDYELEDEMWRGDAEERRISEEKDEGRPVERATNRQRKIDKSKYAAVSDESDERQQRTMFRTTRLLEDEVKEWQKKHLDSEERLLLAARANEKAVRNQEQQLRAKHAVEMEQHVSEGQRVKAERDGTKQELRDVKEEMAVLRGKDMEEKPLAVLQELLTFHQQMAAKLQPVIASRHDSERRAMQEKWMCKVCFEREVTILLQPCNHAVTCGRCASLVACCPICRAAIDARMSVFL